MIKPEKDDDRRKFVGTALNNYHYYDKQTYVHVICDKLSSDLAKALEVLLIQMVG